MGSRIILIIYRGIIIITRILIVIIVIIVCLVTRDNGKSIHGNIATRNTESMVVRVYPIRSNRVYATYNHGVQLLLTGDTHGTVHIPGQVATVQATLYVNSSNNPTDASSYKVRVKKAVSVNNRFVALVCLVSLEVPHGDGDASFRAAYAFGDTVRVRLLTVASHDNEGVVA